MNRKKINKYINTVAIIIFGLVFLYQIIDAPESSEAKGPRVAVFSSIKENPIIFLLLVVVAFAPIILIEHFRNKKK